MKFITAQTQPLLFNENEMDKTIGNPPYEWEDTWDAEADYGEKTMVEIAKHYDLSFEIVNLNGEEVMVFDGNISDTFNEDSDYKDAEEWVNELWDYHLDLYTDFVEDSFWDDIPEAAGVYFYHGTTEFNSDEIISNGLEPRNESRGISNRSMRAGIFTSPEYDTANYYYEAVIQIDVGAMKLDGVMPEAVAESPVEECQKRSAIANQLGLDEYYCETDSSDGLADDTVVFNGSIPAKYLKLL